jgi:hypothetical protein
MKIRNADGSEEEVSDERGQELVNLQLAAPVGDVPLVEKPSAVVSEQEVRWEQAETEYATLQEKRQADTEKRYLELSDNQPRKHETTVPTLHVADDSRTERIRERVSASEESLGVSGIGGAKSGSRKSTKSDDTSDGSATATATATAKPADAKSATGTPKGKS